MQKETNPLMANVTTTLKDAAYVTVGVGVLGFQKAQVRRVELAKQLDEQRTVIETQLAGLAKNVSGTTTEASTKANDQITSVTQTLETQLVELTRAVKELAHDIDARVLPVRDEIEGRIDAFEDRLPEQARELVKQARAMVKDTETQLRSRFGMVTTSAA